MELQTNVIANPSSVTKRAVEISTAEEFTMNFLNASATSKGNTRVLWSAGLNILYIICLHMHVCKTTVKYIFRQKISDGTSAFNKTQLYCLSQKGCGQIIRLCRHFHWFHLWKLGLFQLWKDLELYRSQKYNKLRSLLARAHCISLKFHWRKSGRNFLLTSDFPKKIRLFYTSSF